MKITWKAGTLLYPLPAVMVTVGDIKETNILTIAWTGIINSEPPMTYISVRPERHSYKLLKKNMEFVINLPTVGMVKELDFCGVKSGRNVDKIKELGLELEAGKKIATPSLKNSPISLECKVKNIIPLGSHDMFIAEIVAVLIENTFLDKTGVFRIEKADLVAFSHGKYFSLGTKLGKFGFSVEKKKTKKQTKNINGKNSKNKKKSKLSKKPK